MVWIGFCTIKQHSKVISFWLHVSQLCSIGFETVKKIDFSKKNMKKFWNHKMVWNGFSTIKEQKKSDFLLSSFSLPVQYGGSKQ